MMCTSGLINWRSTLGMLDSDPSYSMIAVFGHGHGHGLRPPIVWRQKHPKHSVDAYGTGITKNRNIEDKDWIKG
jgi:hypothetical protein